MGVVTSRDTGVELSTEQWWVGASRHVEQRYESCLVVGVMVAVSSIGLTTTTIV